MADIEKLREHLGIERWVVFGGSWGSTLALTYAETYPERVLGLILRGIFLGAAEDLDYLYQGNAATWATDPYGLTAPGAYIKYPEEWAALLNVLTPAERGDVMASYKAIFDRVPTSAADKARQMEAAVTWSLWEGVISNMIPEAAATGKFGEANFALCFAQIEAHYFANELFIPAGHFFDHIGVLAAIPIHIGHCLFDEVWPLTQAARLVDALRAAGAVPVQDAPRPAG